MDVSEPSIAPSYKTLPPKAIPLVRLYFRYTEVVKYY
jgi:hypothetical protein